MHSYSTTFLRPSRLFQIITRWCGRGHSKATSPLWFGKGGSPRSHSFWAADSILAQAKVTGDFRLADDLLPALINNYQSWENDHRNPNGLYWQGAGKDGMERSISGDLQPKQQGYRATINSYQFGDASAIAAIAEQAGQKETAA